MALTNAYVTVDELNAWLSNQVPHEQFNEAEVAINAASRWVDRYCDRHFFQATATTRTFVATDYYQLDLGCDLVSVTTFKTDDNQDGTFETTWTTSEYELLTSEGGYNTSIYGEAWPYRKVRTISTRNLPVDWSVSDRRNLVQIVGTWGWSAVPDAVKQATLIQASLLLSRKQSTQGVAGFGEFGVVRIGRDVDPTVRDLLSPYRVAGGVGIA